MPGRLHVGTSGWVYKHWRGPFYPHDLPQTQWLGHYAQRFRTVEINNTFYRMPTANAIRKWRDGTPPGFVFAFKAGRYITHMKRLRDAHRPVRDLLDRLRPMKEKRGPILFQTPPNMPLDLERLRTFLKTLPQGEAQYACEFRHPTWHTPQTLDFLGEHGVAYCIHDLGEPTPIETTATTVYLRFHGTEKPYHGQYGPRKLAPWAERMKDWSRAGHDVYAYFNNDVEAKAVVDAEELGRMVERRTGERVLAA